MPCCRDVSGVQLMSLKMESHMMPAMPCLPCRHATGGMGRCWKVCQVTIPVSGSWAMLFADYGVACHALAPGRAACWARAAGPGCPPSPVLPCTAAATLGTTSSQARAARGCAERCPAACTGACISALALHSHVQDCQGVPSQPLQVPCRTAGPIRARFLH